MQSHAEPPSFSPESGPQCKPSGTAPLPLLLLSVLYCSTLVEVAVLFIARGTPD